MPITSRAWQPVIALGIAAGSLLATSACSKSIDGKSAEQAITAKLQAARPDGGNFTVSCPSSIPVKAGSTFTCTLKADDGSTINITGTQTDENGTFDIKVDDVTSSGPSSTESGG